MKSSKSKKQTSKEIPIITNMVDLLTNLCDSTQEESDNNPTFLKAFISKSPPDITIKKYLYRLYEYSKIELTTFVLILVFIDRLCEKTKIRLNYYNIHKLILAAFVIGIKYSEDVYFENNFYAQVGGVSKGELNILEYEFLCLIEFKVFVDDEIFNKYYGYLETINPE